MWWLVASGWAGDRAPLPSLPVERPVGLPRGWTTLALERATASSAGRWTGAVRYGALPRLELALVGAVATPSEREPRWTAPEARIRATVLRREPPNTSAAVDLRVFGDAAGARLVAAHALGPVRAEATFGGIVAGAWRAAPSPRWTASAEVLLQIGPLAPVGSVELDRGTSAWLGGVVQASRGVQLHLATGWIDGDRATRLAAGVAF
ncbi:MAG: hypothetical protein ABMA64_42895 [Myxococcota bacterium]